MRLSLIAICLMALAGCVPVSLHTICSPDEAGFDPQFVGTWGDGEGYWELTGGNNQVDTYDDDAGENNLDYNGYDVYYTEAGRSSSLKGRLATIDGTAFIDLTPSRGELNGDTGGQMIELMLSWPLHTWARISLDNGKLQMTPVSLDWLNRYLDANPEGLPHIYGEESDWPIITATTEELRAFIAAHMHEDGFFGEMSDLKRLGLPGSHSRTGLQSGNSSYDSQYRSQPASTRQTYESKPAKKQKKKKKKSH